MIETVLFDYDNDSWSGKKALRYAARLIVFAIRKALRLKPERDFAGLCDNYGQILVMLNKMIGVKTVLGIKQGLDKDELIKKLKLIDPDLDVRAHLHIGSNDDPYRQRIWLPALKQSRLSWHFEDNYCNQGKGKLLREDLPCFHFDNPEHLSKYVEFLFLRSLNADWDIEFLD